MKMRLIHWVDAAEISLYGGIIPKQDERVGPRSDEEMQRENALIGKER